MRLYWGDRRANDHGSKEIPLIKEAGSSTAEIAVTDAGLKDVQGHVGAVAWTYSTDQPSGDFVATDGTTEFLANRVSIRGTDGIILHLGVQTVKFASLGRGEFIVLGNTGEVVDNEAVEDLELGTFNTAAGAIRHVTIELDDNDSFVESLTAEQLTFIAFVARASMERKLEKSSMGWTIMLLLLAPLLLAIFFLAG